MTTQALHLHRDAGRWERLRYTLAAVPWHGLRHNGNQALITFAACYAAAQFSMQHDVFPWWVAVPLAGGFEWTYLAGIALASDIRRGLWATLISATAMLSSMAFGMLYILGVYAVIPDQPNPVVAVGLAAAHIIPITLMSFFYAMAHRAHRAQSLADESARATRQQERDDEQQALTDEWRRRKLAIEIEREQLAIDRRRVRLANSRANTPNSPAPAASTAPGTVTNTARTVYEQVIETVRAHPKPNKTELARQLGIGRTQLYAILAQARRRGDLPQD